MPGVPMCPVCRGSKQKCVPVNRIWIPGGRQEKCERCTQYNHQCGPHEYPPPRSRAPRGSGSRVDATPASVPQQIEVPNDMQELKQELRRRLRNLEMQVETTMKLQVALDYSIPGLHRNEDVTAGLFSSRNANVRILALMPSEAEGLADRLAGCGETEAAEAAYIRILNAYREFRKLDLKPFHETKGLLKKLADMLWSTGEHIRAENLVWEALSLRDVPGQALSSDLDLLKSLARSHLRTCSDISKSIQSIQSSVDGLIPPQLSSPFPPLQCMMQSSLAFAVSGSPFHRGDFSGTSITQNVPPNLDEIDTVMDFLLALPVEALEARDVYGQSPFYMASSLRMEGLGRGILRRLADTSAQGPQHHLNNRDLSGQTVLGASILGGCSLQYIEFLIENGSHVDPDPLRDQPYTPLQAAAMSGSLDIVCLLLDNGAEVDRVWPGNPTPLTLAGNAGHPEVVQRLSNTIIGHPSPQIFSLDWSPG